MNDKKQTKAYDEWEKKAIEKIRSEDKKREKWPNRVFMAMAILLLTLCALYLRRETQIFYEVQIIGGIAMYGGTLHLFSKFPELEKAFTDNISSFEAYAIFIGLFYALSSDDLNLRSFLSRTPVKFTIIAYAAFYLALKQQKKETENSLTYSRWWSTISTLLKVDTNQMLDGATLQQIKKKTDTIPIVRNEKESVNQRNNRVYPIVATYKVKKR